MMWNAYKKFWGNYLNFEGVTNRSDFWLAMVVNYLIFAVSGILAFILIASSGINEDLSSAGLVVLFLFFIFLLIYCLAIILPSIAISVRRLRDAGFHWAMIFIGFIPYIGSVASLVLYLMPTKNVEG